MVGNQNVLLKLLRVKYSSNQKISENCYLMKMKNYLDKNYILKKF